MFLMEGGGESVVVRGDLSFKGGGRMGGGVVGDDVRVDVVMMEWS